MSGRREDSSAIAFINLVKSHECIWNYSAPEYSRTDLTSVAWRAIASDIKDTERNCRERWKNIRTAYVRSLKPPKPGTNQNSKKPYYMAEHLVFLQPFLKADTSGNLRVEDSAVEESDTNQNFANEIYVKEEMSDEASTPQLIEPSVHISQTNKKRKRNGQLDDAFSEWMNMKKSTKSDQEADQHFLLSLLPDLKNLSSRRKRDFKIQTMTLLYKLLDDDEHECMQSNISVSSSPSARNWSPQLET